MVGTLVKLQLKLHWREIRASTGMTVANLVMLLLVVSSTLPAMFALVMMRGASVETRGIVTTLGLALLTLMWPIIVTLMTGSNDMLDAGRFALYPVKASRMLPGLLVSAALGLGGLLTLLVGIGYIAAWSTSPISALAAVVGLVLGLATCLVSSRALSAVLAGMLRRRRARDFVMVILVVGILALSTGIQFVSNSVGNHLDTQGSINISVDQVISSMASMAQVAAWTPFGWAWALPWAAAGGQWGQLGLWCVLALAWLAVLAYVWIRQFGQSLISPLEVAGGAEKIKGGNPFDKWLPDTPAGAVAKRSLRYWRRDPRRLVGAIAVVVVPLMMAVAMFASSRQVPADQFAAMKAVVVFAPALIGWMAATSIGWDISYDGSALATQIVAGVSGRDDRRGRLLAWFIIFTPIQVVFIIGFMLVGNRWDLLPAVVGMCVAWLLAGAGVGSWMGAMWQIPQPPAGSNLFGKGANGGVVGFLAAMVAILLPSLIGVPTLVLAVLAGFFGEPYGWLTLLVGAVSGGLTLFLGVRSGGRRLDRTWPEVLAKVTWKG